jgi:hypothetical protein
LNVYFYSFPDIDFKRTILWLGGYYDFTHRTISSIRHPAAEEAEPRRQLSVRRLMQFLTALGHDVEVPVTRSRK